MTAQDIRSRPCSSPAILGRAVATTVWSSAVSSSVSIRAAKTSRVRARPGSGSGSAGAGGEGGRVSVLSLFSKVASKVDPPT
ncbi:hypothetical protein GCM10010214_08920 [Streptomyces abikoensis]|nr:hypothetical protein GCM10010214_08920 [Streptomyces abikoensis]